jgi:hypothetical protein
MEKPKLEEYHQVNAITWKTKIGQYLFIKFSWHCWQSLKLGRFWAKELTYNGKERGNFDGFLVMKKLPQ